MKSSIVSKSDAVLKMWKEEEVEEIKGELSSTWFDVK